MNSRRLSLLLLSFAASAGMLSAQTNTFPSTGNVGIGTTSPTEKLHIEGGAEVIRNNNAGVRLVWKRTDDTQITGFGSDGYSDMTLITNNAERMHISSNGNVGVGTPSPTLGDITVGTPRLEVQAAGSPGMLNYPVARIHAGPDADNTGATLVVNTNNDRGIYVTGGTGIGNQAVGRIGLVNYVGAMADSISLIEGGNVGIGTTNPTQKLSVNGTIQAKEVIVQTNWSDYVFAPDYQLPALSTVEQHIKAEQHLPGIPSAQEVAEHGISLGDMQAKLLAKIEEITLHQIAQEKRIEALSTENAALRHEVESLKQTR